MRSRLLPFICLILLANPATLLAQADFNPGAGAAINSAFPGNGAAYTNINAEDEFLLVDQAYTLNTEFETTAPNEQHLRLNWQIAEGYYLYRHGFNFTLMDGDKLIAVEPRIAKGLEKNDEYFGLVEVYYHNTDVNLGPLPAATHLTLTVTSQGCADAGLCYPPHSLYFQLDTTQLTITPIDKPGANNKATAPLPASTQPDSTQSEQNSLPYILLLALLGGAILNLMPCVFPVLSLKVLGFANDKDHSQAVHGMSYTAGVVLSFIAVAGVLVSLQAAGEAIGWGFHLQTPWFVAALAYLFFVMGLSLSGFVEFGGQWMNFGGKLAQKSDYSGSFFTGILATIVASPCTAPLMGTALGFAITQPKGIALLIFAVLGLGMALPVLLLSLSPRLLNKIPRPGPWMEQLKQLLAFPLYATAVWLCWVVGNQTGVNGMAGLLLGCVLITLAIWLWNGRMVKRTLAITCAALALIGLTSPLLNPSTTVSDTSQQQWQPYSPQTLAQLRQQGKPVFINVTADWCITCLANEKVTLGTDQVKQALSNADMTYLKGDWTNHNPEITALLRQYGRNGIPLYLVYPADNSSRATVLPQILTVSTVLDAIATATQGERLAKNLPL